MAGLVAFLVDRLKGVEMPGEAKLSCMPDVQVLAPKSLRDRIEEKLRDGLARKVDCVRSAREDIYLYTA